MFTVNSDEIKKLEHDLGVLSKRALPHAERAALNEIAFRARREYLKRVRSGFINRNNYTKQSIRVDRASSAQPYSVVGSTAPYMPLQEFSGLKRKRGAIGVVIPTAYSSGEGMGSRVRKRLSRKPNLLRNITLRKNRKKAVNKKQQIIISIRETATRSSKFTYLDLGKTKGVFRVVGKGPRAKIRMVHDMSRRSVQIKKHSMLAPAIERTVPYVAYHYKECLERQIEKEKLFRLKKA